MGETKYELHEQVQVTVGDTTFTGVVDMVGVQRNHTGPQYLVEWVDGKGTVNSRWFSEDVLSTVSV